MRDKKILIDTFEDIKILYQYLYMDEENTITIKALFADMRIRMDDNGNFKALNLLYTDNPELDYSSSMNIQNLYSIIEQLKKQKSKTGFFNSRWEEIKTLTLENVALNIHTSTKKYPLK